MIKLETQLKRLKDPIKNCKICFKPIKISTFRHLFFKNTEICSDCYKEFNPRFIHFSLLDIQAVAIYEYDQTIKDKLFRFKGCYDYELKGVFFDYIKEFLALQYKGYILLPAPSTKIDDEKRGFNHVEEMYSCLKLPIKKGFEKVIDFKQSDLNKEERKDVKNKLKVVDGLDVKGKKVLLVDDVFTTGSTMKAMIELIKEFHPKKIRVLVMSKTKVIQ